MVLLPAVRAHRNGRLPVVLALALFIPGCGNSSNVAVTSPTINRCAVSVTHDGSQVAATGGTGSLKINAERECGWTARVDASWITLSSAQGQGETTVTYSVQPNPEAAVRRAGVSVEQQRVEILQQAAPCRYDVSPSSAAIAGAGGEVNINIGTLSGCPWSVQGGAPWISPEPDAGQGSANVRIAIAVNPGAARTANVTVAGATIPLAQAAATTTPPPPGPAPPPSPSSCSYDVSPLVKSASSAGEQFAVNVRTASNCSWVVGTDVAWLLLSLGTSGVGNGAIAVTVTANSGGARSGTLRVAGQTVRVEQQGTPPPPPPPQTCSYSLKPTSYNAGRGADDVKIDVHATAGCTWVATSSVSWVTVVDGRAGIGDGKVQLKVGANDGAARKTTLVIATLPFSLTQEGKK